MVWGGVQMHPLDVLLPDSWSAHNTLGPCWTLRFRKIGEKRNSPEVASSQQFSHC
jgi:hypothetical protein